MAKSQKTPDVPEIQAKSLGQVEQEAVSANIQSLPQILQAYAQYGPEFSKVLTQNFIDAQKRAPEAYPELYQVLNPLTKAVSGRLNDINNGGIPQGVLQPYQDAVRNAQRLRGTVESPVSTYEEAHYLQPFAEEYKRGVIDDGQNFVSTLNTLRTVPGSDVGLNTLGLTPPNISDSMNLEGQVLQPFREQARLQNYTNALAASQAKAKQKSGQAKMIGGMVGGGAGFIFGGPAGAEAGSQIGQSIGGTFF